MLEWFAGYSCPTIEQKKKPLWTVMQFIIPPLLEGAVSLFVNSPVH